MDPSPHGYTLQKSNSYGDTNERQKGMIASNLILYSQFEHEKLEFY